jgi:hypothetical protein
MNEIFTPSVLHFLLYTLLLVYVASAIFATVLIIYICEALEDEPKIRLLIVIYMPGLNTFFSLYVVVSVFVQWIKKNVL